MAAARASHTAAIFTSDNAVVRSTGIAGGDDKAISASVLGEDALHTTARLVAESEAVFVAMSGHWCPYLEYARERGEMRPQVDLDQAVRWLTFIVFHFLTVLETVL
ncbi:MAG: hypothetical protein ACRDY7_08795, partial [Acidimicrobiia bacterium]